MKLKITYQEDNEVVGLLDLIRKEYKSVKIKYSNNNPPYKHIYVSMKNMVE